MAKVKTIIVHENYDSWTTNNDIALLETTAPLTLGSANAQKIALPADGNEPSGNVKTSGWGYLKEGGGTLPADLQIVEVPVVDRARCNTAYSNRITDAMFCAGDIENGGKDACQVCTFITLLTHFILQLFKFFRRVTLVAQLLTPTAG